jgi:hypothetical protein
VNKGAGISPNAVTALSLLGMSLVVGLYDLAGHGGQNVTEHSPQWLRNLEFPIFGVATPLILLGMGFVVAFAIRGSRPAYLGLAAFGVFYIVMNIEPTVTRWHGHGIEHAFICVVNILAGLLIATFAYRAYREPPRPEAEPVERAVTASLAEDGRIA